MLRLPPGDTHRFWTDRTFRLDILARIADAYTRHDDVALQRHLMAVDDHVAAGMRAQGYRRAPVSALSLTPLPDIAGVKQPDCHLKLGLEAFEEALSGSPDDVVVTWLHESVHRRHGPWRTVSLAAWHYVGFEEGLAEGIAHSIAQQFALAVSEPLYPQYLRAYDILAEHLSIEPDRLFRQMWRAAHDQIETSFSGAVAAIVRETRPQPLTPIQRGKLTLAAQALFATRRTTDALDDDDIRRIWESVI